MLTRCARSRAEDPRQASPAPRGRVHAVREVEEKLERYPGNRRARRSSSRRTGGRPGASGGWEALLVVSDREHGYIISGSGELIEPDDGVLANRVGGSYALASARRAAHCRPPRQGHRAALARDRGRICVYTHAHHHSGALMAEPTRTPKASCPPRRRRKRRCRGSRSCRPGRSWPSWTLHRGPGSGEESRGDRVRTAGAARRPPEDIPDEILAEQHHHDRPPAWARRKSRGPGAPRGRGRS